MVTDIRLELQSEFSVILLSHPCPWPEAQGRFQKDKVPQMSEVGRGQENCKFKASPGYAEKPYFLKPTNQQTDKPN